MMKKYIQASVLAILMVMLAGCNAAENGFNAPVNASVTIQPASIDVTFAGGGEI